MKLLFLSLFIGIIISAPDFQKLENSEFGKSLLDTVQVQLGNSASIDALLQLLDKLRDQMNEQKENYEHDHQSFQSDCAKDIDFYQQEIASATVKVVDTQRQLDQTNEGIKVKESLLEQLYQQYDMFNGTRTKLIENRQEEATEFARKNGENDATVTAIEEAKQFFVKVRNEIQTSSETSFLQEKEKEKSEIMEIFNYGKQQVTSPKFQAIFTVLSHVAQQQESSPEVIAKLLELCNRVLKNIQDSRMAETEAENKRIEGFTSKMEVLDSQLNMAQTRISSFENEQGALEQSVKINEGIKEEQIERRDENQKLMDNRIQECQVEGKDYEELREKTLEQIRTVEMVITSVQTNLAVMKQYLRERRAETGNTLDLDIK